jgi:hypothetical protein
MRVGLTNAKNAWKRMKRGVTRLGYDYGVELERLRRYSVGSRRSGSG